MAEAKQQRGSKQSERAENYSKPVDHVPTSKAWLEEATSEDYAPSVVAVPVNPDPRAQNTDEDFVGVSPEYQNYADDTGKPLRAEEGPEKVLEDQLHEYYNPDSEGEEPSDAVKTNYEALTAGVNMGAGPEERNVDTRPTKTEAQVRSERQQDASKKAGENPFAADADE